MANDFESTVLLPSVENVQLMARRPQRTAMRVILDRSDVACENWQLSCRQKSMRTLLRVTEVELAEQQVTWLTVRSTDEENGLHRDDRSGREARDEFGAASTATSVAVSKVSTSVTENRRSDERSTSGGCVDADHRRLENAKAGDVDGQVRNSRLVGGVENTVVFQTDEERLREEKRLLTTANTATSNTPTNVETTSSISTVADAVVEDGADLESGDILGENVEERTVHDVGGGIQVDASSCSLDVIAAEADGDESNSRAASESANLQSAGPRPTTYDEREERQATENKGEIRSEERHELRLLVDRNDPDRRVEKPDEGAISTRDSDVEDGRTKNNLVDETGLTMNLDQLTGEELPDGYDADNLTRSNADSDKSLKSLERSDSDYLSRSGATETDGLEYRNSLIPDVTGDRAGELWESIRRVYDPKGELRDGDISRAPSEWSAMSEMGSEIGAKMQDITDFDDRSSVASNEEQESNKVPDVTGEERNTGDSSSVEPKTEDENAAPMSVDVQRKKVGQSERRVPGRDGIPKDDIRLDNITSPRRSIVYVPVDIDIDDGAPLGKEVKSDRTRDQLPSKETTSAPTTLDEYQITDDGLSVEMDKMSSVKNSEMLLKTVAVDRNLEVLRQSWDDIQAVANEGDEQNETAILKLQQRNDDALNSISSWLESIRLKMASEDVVFEQDVDEDLKSAEQRLDDVERSVPMSVPMDQETKKQLADLRDALKNVQLQISALQEERKLKQLQADERSIWLQYLQDNIHEVENDLLQCQRLAEKLLVPASDAERMSAEDKDHVADKLIEQCQDGLAKLIALNSSVDKKHETDPNIFAPAEMAVLHQHWKALLEKIEKAKSDFALQAAANEQFENGSNELEQFLKKASETLETTNRLAVADVATLTKHIDADKSLLDSLTSKAASFEATAAGANGGARETYRQRITNLHSLTSSLKDSLTSRLEMMSCHAVEWRDFDSRVHEESVRLDVIADQLSIDLAGKHSPEVLLQKLDDCNALSDTLTSHRQDVTDVVNKGRQIMLHIDCTRIEDQIQDLERQYHALVDKAVAQNEPLRTTVRQLDSFKSDIEAFELFLSRVEPQVKHLNDLTSGDKLEADVISQSYEILQLLRSGCDEQQPCKTRLLSCRNSLLHVLHDDDPAFERLQIVEDHWSRLLEEISSAEQRLSDAQLALMPSTQAAEELKVFLSGVCDTLERDDKLRPSSFDEVQNLSDKYTVIGGEVSDRQRTIAYLAECVRSLSASETEPHQANTVALIKRFEDVTRQYHAVSGDVSDRVDALRALLPQWKNYRDSVGSIADWLDKQTTAIAELKSMGGNEDDDFCQLLNSELVAKKAEVDKLDKLSESLRTSGQRWPSDPDSVAAELNTLRGGLSTVETELSTLRTINDGRRQLIANYELTIGKVKKTLSQTEVSLKDADESGGGDLPTHSAKVIRLKDLQRSFIDAAVNLNELSECLQSLSRALNPATVQPYSDRYTQIVDSWVKQQQALDDSALRIEHIEKEWTDYNLVYETQLARVAEYREELETLSKDGLPENRCQKLTRAEALLSNLDGVRKSCAELQTIRSRFAGQLNDLACAKTSCDLITLNTEVNDLHCDVHKLCEQIRSDEDVKSKCDAEYGLLRQFLDDGLIADDDLKKSVDVVDRNLLQKSLSGVEENLRNLHKMKPTLAQLSLVQLDKPHSDRMRQLNDEWMEKLRQLEAIKLALEQRQERLMKFKEKCKRWLDFLASVEADLANQTVASYSALHEEREKWEKFSSEKPTYQQQLNALIGEGTNILADTIGAETGTERFRDKLRSLEEQWKSVSKQSEERKSCIGNLLSSWRSFKELAKKLSNVLDQLRLFIDRHSVSECAVDDFQSLLDEYKVARKQLLDSQAQYDQLRLLLSQLQPSDIVVSETDDNPAKCVEDLVARRQHLSVELDQLVGKLEVNVALLEEARVEIDDMVASQVVIKQSIVRELPVRQEDLAKELAELKAVEIQLNSEDRTNKVVEKLSQLCIIHTPESGESSALSRRLGLLNDQRIETIERVLLRQKDVGDKLRRWSDWDAHYEQLVNQLRSIDTKITELESLSIEEAAVKLQNELLPENEFIGSQKNQLLGLKNELSTVSDAVLSQDMSRKATALSTMWKDQRDNITTRLKKLTDSLNDVDLFDVQMKNLRQWLIETKDRLARPVVFQNANSKELQRHYKEQMAMQADIDSRSVAISSLLNLSESLMSDKMACPTETERKPIQMAVQELDDMWPAIKSDCTARRAFLEETDELWRQFDADVKALRKKLSVAEGVISRSKSDKTLSDIGSMIGKLKDMKQNEFSKLSADLSKLNASYTKLVQKKRTDQSGVLQKSIDEANESWTAVDQSAGSALRDLEKLMKMKEAMEADIQLVHNWLSSLEADLSNAEALNFSDLESALLNVNSDLEKNAGRLNDLDTCMEALVKKCHRLDGAKIRQKVDGIHKLHAQVLAHLRKLTLSTAAVSPFQVPPVEGDDVELPTYIRKEFGVEDVDSDLPNSLVALEEWLTSAELSVKVSSKSKPSSRAKSNLRALQRDIINWEPRVLDIRSSTSTLSSQTSRTELLCDRISLAIGRWNNVRHRVNELSDRMKSPRPEPSVSSVEASTASLRHDTTVARTLKELEQWLSSTKDTLQRQSMNLRDTTHCELILSQLNLISADITTWRCDVADIRSSSHAFPNLNTDRERMCDRISSAMEEWTSICDVVPKRIGAVACFLMADDSFRLGVDDLLGRVDDIRHELRAIDAAHVGSKRSDQDRRQLLKQLTDILLELHELKLQASKFHNIAECLVHSSRPDTGRRQLEQITTAKDEIQLMEQNCKDLVTSLGGSINSGVEPSVESQGDKRSYVENSSAWDRFRHMIGSWQFKSDRTRDDSQPELEEVEAEVIQLPLLLGSVDGNQTQVSPTVVRHVTSGDEGRASVLSRACLIAVPVQVLGFLLLGFAALVPLCDEDCARSANTFLYSLQPMLRYYDGLPPL